MSNKGVRRRRRRRLGDVRSRVGLFTAAIGTVRRADPRGSRIAGVLQLSGAVSGLGVVLASKLALDAVTGDTGSAAGGLALALGLLALSVALSQSLAVFQGLQQRLLTQRVQNYVWDDLMATTASVGLATWQRTSFMDHLERVRTNALQRPTAVVNSLFGLVGALLGTVALVLALIALQPLLVPVLLLAGVPAVVLARRASALEFGYSVAVNPVLRRQFYLKLILSDRDPAAEVRAFEAAPYLLNRHAQANGEVLDALRAHIRRRGVLALLATVATVATLALTFAFIGFLLLTGRMSLAAAGASAIAARLLSSQLATVFTSVGTLIECAPFLRDLQNFHGLRDDSGRTPGRRRPLTREMHLSGVSFSYEGRKQPAVDNVDLVIPRGRVVALVGENGSGKTTLSKLVAGLFESDVGTVSWDQDTAISAADLRASTSVLFQDFVRYQMTARENIAISRGGTVDEEAVRSAAARANVADTIDLLPQGYDTMLGLELAEGGELSGGQWQRLALARAFYRDCDLVILDEPSAALDPRAEWELFRDVRSVLDGRAALLISHRYSSVQLADYIYVLHEGNVVEEGTHTDLMSIPDGRYAELYTLQAAAYLDGAG